MGSIHGPAIYPMDKREDVIGREKEFDGEIVRFWLRIEQPLLLAMIMRKVWVIVF